MVGTLGDVALAAVGMGSFANFMSVAFLQGFSTGVQAISARRKGELRLSESAAPLNAALVVVFAVGIPLSLVLSNASAFIFESLHNSFLILSRALFQYPHKTLIIVLQTHTKCNFFNIKSCYHVIFQY